MKKALSLLLIAILCVGLFAGCAGGEKGRVYWLNFKPESDEVLQEVAKMYTEETGVEVKVLTAASGTYNQTLLAEMDKAEAPTLFVIGNQNAVKEWKDYALNLKDSAIAKELNTDAYNMYDADGNLVSIGYCYECYGIIVNPTLIEKAGYKMDDLKNFEGLKKVAEDIHKRAKELGFDAFSASDMDDSSSWRFTGHMANLEYYYESRDAGGWKECPAEIKGTYMENFKNLYDLCINNSMTPAKELATGGHDAQNQFKTGKAAFYVNGSWEYSAVAEAVPNATMIPYYAGVEGEEKAGLNCGTENYWAINSKVSKADQKATMDFMVWCVTNEEASRKLVDTFGVMPYKSAAESTNGFLAAANKYSADGCYVMDWATNYQPNVDEYRKALVSALNAYNANQTEANWAKVKTAFVDGWAYQYKQINK
ncbi:MAG: ABC transporter substrate-binding protein [Clostridia bacterium]|nr:ABC transporter substrate-binding protein [Clostridia bacterium]MBO5210311.1 ABC transporter substrate-binding protein [Clostridia bacterium]